MLDKTGKLNNSNELFILQFPKWTLNKLSIYNLTENIVSAKIEGKGQMTMNINNTKYTILNSAKIKSNIEFASLDKRTNILHILGNIKKEI